MKKQSPWLPAFGLIVLVPFLVPSCGPSSPTPSPTAPITVSKTTPAAPVAPSKTTPVASATKPAPSSPVSFAGKTITIVVPYPAGGGGDITSRVYARFLPKFLAGRPNIVVRNMPGADGTIGANFVYNAKPDGLTLMTTSASIPINQLIGMKAVRYDLTKMPIAVANSLGGMFYAKSGLIAKPEDLPKAKGLVFGAGPQTSPTVLLFLFAKELLDIPAEKVVVAYAGSGDVSRAFLSGEINMASQSVTGYNQSIAPSVAKGEVMVVMQTGVLNEKAELVKDAGAPPDSLTVKELYEKLNNKPPSGIAWDAYMAMVSASYGWNKLLCLPPGTPDNIVRTYWQATEPMIKDPDFLNVADVGATWSAGESLDRAHKAGFQIKPELREWIRGILPKYGVAVD